jgi:hypothetical protein
MTPCPCCGRPMADDARSAAYMEAVRRLDPGPSSAIPATPPELGDMVWFRHRDRWLCGLVVDKHTDNGRACCSVAVIDRPPGHTWWWRASDERPGTRHLVLRWLVPIVDCTVASPPSA